MATTKTPRESRDAIAEKMALASAAVGHTPAEYVRWLSDFADRDLSLHGSSEQAAAEMYLFLRAVMRDIQLLGETAADYYPTTGEVAEAQLEVRKFIRKLAADSEVPYYFSYQPVSFFVSRSMSDSSFRLGASGTAKGLFLTGLILLVLELQRRLRWCEAPGCARIFVADRARQRYCDRVCQNRATQARYRAKRAAELSDRRHHRHVAKQKRTLGSAVKVARRKTPGR